MESDGNLLATLVFFAWVPLTLWAMKRYAHRPALATAALLIGAVMFLPERVKFKPPGLPAFSKEDVAVTWMVIALLLNHGKRLRELELGRAVKLLLVIFPIGAVFTVLANRDAQVFGRSVLPPMQMWDTVHLVVSDLMAYMLPFVIGAAMFRRRKDMHELLMCLSMASLVYVPLILLEARLSPQLHNWVYGFAQHSFLQTIRGDGYRPMVFMNHGLAVSLFLAAGVIAAFALKRAGLPILRLQAGWASWFLGWVLVVCKSVGSLVYGVVGAIAVSVSSPKMQLRLAMGISSLLMLYPLLRLQGLVPTDDIVQLSTDMAGADRAQSLEFRLVNEDVLFDRAMDRPTFGWGFFGRACVWDPLTGDELSVRDGAWIITLGERGIFVFFATFGLLLLPIFRARRALAEIPSESDRLLLAALALIVGIHAFDLIPNGRYSYMSYLFAGALHGLITGLPAEARQRRARHKAAVARNTPPGLRAP